MKPRRPIDHLPVLVAMVVLLLAIGVVLALTREAVAKASSPGSPAVSVTAVPRSTEVVDFTDVDFVDANKGWAVGWRGAIFHTADGGLTWQQQDGRCWDNLQGVTFADALNGWVGGSEGVLHTADGGQTWFREWVRNGGTHWTDASSPQICYDAAGADMARTSDGGARWTLHRVCGDEDPHPFSGFVKVQAVTATSAWAGGDGVGTVQFYATADGGTTWQKVGGFIPEGQISDWCFVGQTGIAVGYDFAAYAGCVWRSTDGGRTWTKIWVDTGQEGEVKAGALMGLDASGSVLLACANNGWILKSTDTGATWHKVSWQLPGYELQLRAIDVIDETHACCADDAGHIIISGDGGISWTLQTPISGLTHDVINPYTGDTISPTVTVSGVYIPKPNKPYPQYNRALDISFSATDTGGSGMATVQLLMDLLDPVAWRGSVARPHIDAPANHSNDGNHLITAWALDNAENSGTVQVNFGIDTKPPTVKVTKNLSVRKGKMAYLNATVSDPLPSQNDVNLKLTIRKKSGKVVKTVVEGPYKGGFCQIAFKCKLAKGTYRFTITAADTAGNVSKPSATHYLHVK